MLARGASGLLGGVGLTMRWTNQTRIRVKPPALRLCGSAHRKRAQNGCARVLGTDSFAWATERTLESRTMAEIPESHRDLLDAQVATLATVDAEGFPQLTEVWFVHDGGTVRISLSSGRHKTRNLQERPQCSLLILDLKNPYRYLELRGRAQVEEDDGSLIERVKEKYQADVREYDAPGERRLAVTIEPVKVHAVIVG